MRKILFVILIVLSAKAFAGTDVKCDYPTWKMKDYKDFTTSEKSDLAIESRKQILKAGVSESYLKSHFKFVCGVKRQRYKMIRSGEKSGFEPTGTWIREVLWKLTLGDYVFSIHGPMDSDRDVSLFAENLGDWKNPPVVIPKTEALAKLKTCVGEFKVENASTYYEQVENLKLQSRAGPSLTMVVEKDVPSTRPNDPSYSNTLKATLDLKTGVCSKEAMEYVDD